MTEHAIDIIVPVWNRPTETRHCLVTLAENSPGGRFILFDNGSDRETERLLQEFAERLDERALLLRTDVNQGYVRGVNRGLARAEAPLTAVVRNTSVVSPGWLEPLFDCVAARPEAGIFVPRIVAETGGKGASTRHPELPRETGLGSLAAMVIRKSLYEAAGGLDEELDGGEWCLRDFTQRALRHGFLTLSVPASRVSGREEPPLGSAERRAETLRRSAELYRERWGTGESFCLFFPAGTTRPVWEEKRDTILTAARRGHRFTVLADGGLYRELVRSGDDRLHDGIVLVKLPRLLAERAAVKALAALRKEGELVTVCGVDGIPFPGGEAAVSFPEMARRVAP